MRVEVKFCHGAILSLTARNSSIAPAIVDTLSPTLRLNLVAVQNKCGETRNMTNARRHNASDVSVVQLEIS